MLYKSTLPNSYMAVSTVVNHGSIAHFTQGSANVYYWFGFKRKLRFPGVVSGS